ncbi:hypothetical protein FXO38_13543 [Capsicum annuum]|nr:hypothetical protein FXO38_13543 [Capsicum annuum]
MYKGKQLIRYERTLANYVKKMIQLLGSMLSTYHAKAWKLISGLISMISDIFKNNVCFPSELDRIIMLVVWFTTMTPEENIEKSCDHMELLVSSSVPVALELNSTSELFNCSDVLWQKMRQRKISLCFLIVILAKCFDDYWWVISTRRSQLLEESIEFIGDMDPTLLRGNLFRGLKNEEATELGLLKEWLISGNANHLWTGANTERGYVISKRNMLLGIVEMIDCEIGTNTQSKAAIDGEKGIVAYGLGGGMHGTKLMCSKGSHWNLDSVTCGSRLGTVPALTGRRKMPTDSQVYDAATTVAATSVAMMSSTNASLQWH